MGDLTDPIYLVMQLDKKFGHYLRPPGPGCSFFRKRKPREHMEPQKLTSDQRELYNYALYSCLSFQNAPYLAPILVRLKPLSLPGLKTLASDSKGHVFIDFDFLESNKVGIEDFGRVVQHEAWHVINMHSIVSAEVHGQYYACLLYTSDAADE